MSQLFCVETVPVRTVNRQCSSGLQAVADVAAAIRAGFYDIGKECIFSFSSFFLGCRRVTFFEDRPLIFIISFRHWSWPGIHDC